MGSHFKERLCAPDSRLLGMFVKFPTMETIEILASAGLDFVIIDMEHAPLSIDVVYRMVVTAELAGASPASPDQDASLLLSVFGFLAVPSAPQTGARRT